MNIILFGPPGAGKGTQADNLVKKFNLFKISTGDLLRREVKENSELGENIKSIIDKGSFVSDDIINNLIEKILINKNYFNRLIFDGYPRNIDQARNLDLLLNKYKQKISLAISLNVEKEIIVKRILGRQICEKCGKIFNTYFNPANKKNHSCENVFLQKRTDDNKDTIEKRYEDYLKKTLPLLNFYKQQNLLREINGKSEIEVIYEEICSIIGTLDA